MSPCWAEAQIRGQPIGTAMWGWVFPSDDHPPPGSEYSGTVSCCRRGSCTPPDTPGRERQQAGNQAAAITIQGPKGCGFCSQCLPKARVAPGGHCPCGWGVLSRGDFWDTSIPQHLPLLFPCPCDSLHSPRLSRVVTPGVPLCVLPSPRHWGHSQEWSLKSSLTV